MLSTRYCTILIAIASLTTATAFAQDYGSPSPNVPELSELTRFVGAWTGQLGNTEVRINATRRWVLGGHFLQHDFTSSGGELSGIIFRGYDKDQNEYTLTMLDSEGNTSLLTGTWNADTRTFTFEAVDGDCKVQRYESYFPDEKTEQWTITFSPNQAQVSGTARKNS